MRNKIPISQPLIANKKETSPISFDEAGFENKTREK